MRIAISTGGGDAPGLNAVIRSVTDHLVSLFNDAGIDALVTIGGDGSLAIGQRLHEAGLRVVGVPKTIDNDLDKTSATFGFDTAVQIATELIDRVFTTATSHSRLFVVEVMGRYAGWIALHAGVVAGAHAILIPAIPHRLEAVAEAIERRRQRGANFSVVVVAEGAVPSTGERSVIGKAHDQAERLGGVGERVAHEVTAMTGTEARTVVLGHVVHGGTPTAHDRLLGNPLRRRRGTGDRGRALRRDGGVERAERRLRAADRRDRCDAHRADRLGHDPRRARRRDLPRRLSGV